MKETDNTPESNLHLALLIHLTNQFKDQLIGQFFTSLGVTGAQFKVLISIYKGFHSPQEISKNLVMDSGAMSRMLERMVKGGLIVRNTNPADKRQVLLTLTEKGYQISDRYHKEALDTIISSLTTRLTESESQQLADLMMKMLPDDITEPHLLRL